MTIFLMFPFLIKVRQQIPMPDVIEAEIHFNEMKATPEPDRLLFWNHLKTDQRKDKKNMQANYVKTHPISINVN